MIGRVQDVMSAAIVKGAAESAGASGAAAGSTAAVTASQQASRSSGEQGVASIQNAAKSPLNEAMKKPSVNDVPSQQAEAEKKKQEEPMDEKSVSLMTKELNELMNKINCDLKFQYHKEVDVMSVAMIDKSTDEVIKEFPPEEMVKNMIKAKEWIGAFLDRNA